VDGRQAWLYEGELTYIPMGSCRALPGFDEAGYPPAPGTARFDEIRPGCYDPVERLKDMDVDGVCGQLCFPNYARFAGHRFFLNVKDHDLGLACLQAYNDYLLDTWCATDPARLFGAVILPLHDLDLALAELDRTLAKGAKAVAFSENPTVLGLPSVHTDHWNRLWASLDEARIPVCMHIGSSSRLVTTSDDAPPTVLVSLNGLNSMMAGVDWLLSGILERFPHIKVILSEGGAGWIPYILERADKAFHDKRIKPNAAIGQTSKGGTVPPSQLFRDHMFVCLVDEQFALRALDDIGADNLLWEGDYPHGDGLWPHNRDYLEKALTDVPEVDAMRIAEHNLRGLLRT
jgi:predicted TIM-barrel fold metal-dependent hydrolase